MSRDRIDEVRRLLVEAFMTEEMTVYTACVVELERLIGVAHGDRNHHDTSRHKSDATNKKTAAKARNFRWGKRSLDAEVSEDGILTYSIKYGDENAD